MRQTIEVEVLATPEATVVEAKGGTYLETGMRLVAQGYAKKHPKDTNDAEVGHALAVSRALRELADAYEKRAWERINHPCTYKYATGGMLTTTPQFSYDIEGTFDQKWLDRMLGGGVKK
jgi:hypothetical protein